MGRIRTILAPTDFSKFSEAALRLAGDLAQQFAAELHLLHVAPTSRDVGAATDTDHTVAARQQLKLLLEPHEQIKLQVHHEVHQGMPAKVIRRYAQQHHIDLVVMGTHGRTGLAHVVRGSVAESVLRSCPCPVLIVRPDQRELDAPLVEASQVLKQRFGETLAGERRESRAQLRGRLQLALQTSDVHARQLLEQLESRTVVTWNNDHWTIRPEALDDHAPQHKAVSDAAADSQPALDLVRRAMGLRATDIHIDPTGNHYTVRFRIDGHLEKYCELDEDVADHLVHQLKLLARQDFADPFRPKEGRLHLPASLDDLEVRLTTAPVAGGEAIALRLFSSDNVFYPLSNLGFADPAFAGVQEMLRQGEGLVLITGPTGSGKSTTVYSMLQILSEGHRNIVSIEDPVEFPVSFVRQMNVDERHDVTMTSGLRTLLRMDPDIVFVGEIRDPEAAYIAMRAAASGRHVFSTLHTRDVASTVTALRDLNVENHSLAANLNGIVNQRLMRRLCDSCRRPHPLSDAERRIFADNQLQPPKELCEPVGCEQCRGTGYRGRVGVFEVAVCDAAIADAISSGAPERDLRELLRSSGTPSLTADALAKVRDLASNLSEALQLRWL